MTVVLRKSHGAFSAGTPVNVLDRDKRHKVNLCTALGTELHVHDDDLVTRRSCEYVSTQPPRWIRRRHEASS